MHVNLIISDGGKGTNPAMLNYINKQKLYFLSRLESYMFHQVLHYNLL